MRKTTERAPADGPDHGAGRTRRILRALTTHRRSGVLAALAAAVALGLAGCGGPVSGGVANVTTTSGAGRADAAGSATTTPKDNPAQLLVEWADCMRRHYAGSEPERPDHRRPRRDQHLHIPSEAISLSERRPHNGTAPCNGYPRRGLLRLACRGDGPPAAGPGRPREVLPVHAGQRRPQLPRPRDGGHDRLQRRRASTRNSPFVERANNICGKRIHAPSWWIGGAGPPGQRVGTERPELRWVAVPPGQPRRLGRERRTASRGPGACDRWLRLTVADRPSRDVTRTPRRHPSAVATWR